MAARGFGWLFAALALTAPSLACAPGPSSGTATIRIGFTSSQTGALAKESTEQTQGLRLWAEVVRAEGGLEVGAEKLGLELISYDDESRQDRVQQLYTRLITEDGADFLISPYSSASAAAAAVVTEQYGRTHVVVGAASDSIFARGYRHAFQVYSPASKYLTGALDMLRRLDPPARRLALVYEKDPLATDVVRAAREYAEGLGFEVLLHEGYDSGTTNFAPLITKIGGLNPDAILGGGHFADGSTLARQIAEKRLKTKLVALLVAPAVPEFAQLGDAALGIVAPSHWESQARHSPEAAAALGIPYFGPPVDGFVEAYRRRYGYEPGYHAAAGYAAGLILQKAVAEAGTAERGRVEAALARMDVLLFCTWRWP